VASSRSRPAWWRSGRPSAAKEEVGAEDIAEVVSRLVGCSAQQDARRRDAEAAPHRGGLHNRVVGQDDAINAIANAVRRGRAGLADPKRPIGSFIFLGPTGVGKTEVGTCARRAAFDDEHSMIRIDMSEYMEKHTVSRLVGAPPGYVGYEEGGQLTRRCGAGLHVLLLDEIEKAHPDVFNILLQLLEDGRLTDGQGRTVDFRNCVVIMTRTGFAAHRRGATGGRQHHVGSSSRGGSRRAPHQLPPRVPEPC